MKTEPILNRTLVFIPTLNDIELLTSIIEQLFELDGEYVPLVIDDGSTPRLPRSALPPGCMLFSLPINLGLGMCTHIAFDHALKYEYDAFLRIDSDGQHPVIMAPELMAPIFDGQADLVVGTRQNHGEGVGFGNSIRNLVKSYFSFVASAITQGNLPKDVNSGFFALNRKAIEEMNKTSLERFPEPQIFITAYWSSLRLSEVSIEQHPRRFGETALSLPQAARLIFRFTIFAAGEFLNFRRRWPY